MSQSALDAAVVAGAEGIVDASHDVDLKFPDKASAEIRARAKIEALAVVEEAARAKALLEAAASVVRDSERLARVETKQVSYGEKIETMETTIVGLTEAMNKLSFRIAVGLVVIFSGTENGSDLLGTVVNLVTR